MALPTDINPFVQFAGASGPDLGDTIDQSLRFRNSISPTFTCPVVTAGARTWTWSGWVKKCGNSADLFTPQSGGSASINLRFRLSVPDNIGYQSSTSGISGPESTALFRDPSAWYHVVCRCDRTTNLMTIFVNGEQVAQGATNNTMNFDTQMRIGQSASYFGSGKTYFADVYCIDGQALDPTDFGRYNKDGVWVPQTYTGGNYGDNGFHLTFDSGQTNGIGHDSSGNGNHFTPASGFDTVNTSSPNYDLMQDSPTQNFATLNPLYPDTAPTRTNAGLLLDGNLGAYAGINSPYKSGLSTILPAGDCYWEVHYITTPSSSTYSGMSTVDTNQGNVSGGFWGYLTTQGSSSAFYQDGSQVSGNTNTLLFTAGDIASYYYNASANTLTIYINGNQQGAVDTSMATEPLFINHRPYGTDEYRINYGQQPFVYRPAAIGDDANLQTNNLAEPTIKNGSDHFRALTGTGANILAIAQGTNTNGTNWNPDVNRGFTNGLWWIHDRTVATNPQLVDSVNGTTSVRPSGGENSSVAGRNNRRAYIAPTGDCVAYCWNSSNPSTSGFSITNGTHGLGAKPFMVINNDGWIYHESIADFGYSLTTSAMTIDGSNTFLNVENWNVTGTTITSNAGGPYYAWRHVPGYNEYGSYTGTSNADGQFFYCGFRPAFVMTTYAGTSSGDSRRIYDSTRSTFNPATSVIYVSDNSGYVEATEAGIDIVSNGWKLRNSSHPNVTGIQYIWTAFAESPFGGENTPPVTAR